MAYPNQSSTSSTSTSLPYPHSYAYPYLYAPHPHSNLSNSSSSSTSFTPYSSTTPATTAPPSPTSTSSNTHAINLQRYYHHLNTFHPSSSNTSDHHQHYNMHHQSHPHLFPEQIQSASSFRPPSSQSHHSANGGVAAGGTTGSAAVSPYAQHGGHSGHAGPALQVAHPTAAANSLDMYRHRSASPWVSPHQQQQQQQQHHITQPYQAYGSNAGHNTSHSSSNSGALSLFNPTSYQHPSQHPLAQQSTHHHHNTYAFPSHYNNGHDPYHSPEASHATLPYGFPTHPAYHHSYSSSSILDKHVLNPSSASVSRSNTPSHPYGSNKYPHLMQSESNMRSKIGGGSTNSSDKLPKMRITSGASVGSAEGGADSTMSTAGAGGRKSKGSKEGSSGADDVAPGGAANYGIIDELNTTLFDLRDGPDGPRGKPPYPYLTLIRIALISAPTKKLTLQELYDTLESRWPGHFAGDQKGWKNSIRHNLSLNKCFKKEARHILDPGKGAYWYCDLNEEHSTPRIRHRRKGDGEGEYDAEGEFVQPQPSGSKRGAARGKKRRVESPPSGVTGNAPDAYPPYPGYLHDDYTSTKQDSYSAHEDHVRSVKLRVGDLKLPFNTTSSSSSSGGLQIKRQRAISAPSPITPSFFNNFTSATQVGNDQQQYETKEEVGELGLAPFGITSVGAGHHTSSYGSQQQPYSFPQIFTQPTQLQVPKYEFPSSIYGAPSGVSASVHQLPAMPSLMPDKAPQSGSTESSFALETPRTIYSGSNAAARPGTANSVSNGAGEAKPGLERLVKEENSSSVNLAAFSSSLNEGNTHGNDNGNSDNPPGPAQSYVFPATQKGPPESGQSKRVFVNPPGTSTATTAVTTLNTTISSVSPRGVHQSPPQQDLQGEVHVNAPLGNYAMPSSGIPPHPHATSSSPFAVPHNQSAASSEDMRNRPSHLHINPKDGKNMFSPPSATSPTRHLNSEYGDMFSTAPFGLIFDAPSAKGTGRKGSLLGGLTAR